MTAVMLSCGTMGTSVEDHNIQAGQQRVTDVVHNEDKSGANVLAMEVDGSMEYNVTVPPLAARGSIGVIPLAMIVFFNVSGGPFGIEETVRSAGFLYAILGFAIFPFIWSVPESLITAELGSAYPEASGGVVWVEEAFGKRAGFQAGYLGWIAGATDNAIYPVLFLDYVIQLWSSAGTINPFIRYILIAAVSAILGFLNWLGLEIVGKMSVFIGILSLAPFVVMIGLGIFQIDPHRWLETLNDLSNSTSHEAIDQNIETRSSFVGSVMTIASSQILWRPFLNNLFWSLNSFDSTASYSGEVDNPGRTLPRAMFFAVMMVACGYLFPLMVAIGATDSSPEEWIDGYMATAAGSIGGEWLEAWVILAAGVANISLFQAELSADAYQLMGMADRGFVHKIFSTRSRYGTPTYGILLGVIVIVSMGSFDLERLVELLNMNYALSLLMEYAAFYKLRLSKPEVPRPFRIPLGNLGCAILLLFPIVATLAVICLATYRTLIFSLAVNVFGILAYDLAYLSRGLPCLKLCCRYGRVNIADPDSNEENTEDNELRGLS